MGARLYLLLKVGIHALEVGLVFLQQSFRYRAFAC